MPYGDLAAQACQRFATYADLDRHDCTIEEREEYEPHIDAGVVVYAGVDYERILREAEQEADVILWDGGNNDLPFYVPDLHVVLADPLRPGDEAAYHPGEANVRMADVVVVAKCDSAPRAGHRGRRGVGARPQPARRRCCAPTARSPSTTRAVATGQARHRRRGRPDADPRLDELRRRCRRRPRSRCRRHRRPHAVSPWARSPRPTRSTRTRAASCRRWATARRRPATSRPRSARRSTRARSTRSCRGTPIDITRVLTVDVPLTRARYDLREQEPGRLAEALAKALGR